MIQQQLQIDYDMQRLCNELFQILSFVPSSRPEVSDDQHIVFRIDNTCYRLPAQRVHVIHPLQRYTPLPYTRPWIVGVVSVRSRLLIIVDIRPLLAYEHRAPAPDSIILWVTLYGMDIGLLADSLVTASNAAQIYTNPDQMCFCRIAS
jgi:chemotaxis signal transduction protein